MNVLGWNLLVNMQKSWWSLLLGGGHIQNWIYIYIYTYTYLNMYIMRKSVNLSPFMSSFFPITFSLQASFENLWPLWPILKKNSVFGWGFCLGSCSSVESFTQGTQKWFSLHFLNCCCGRVFAVEMRFAKEWQLHFYCGLQSVAVCKGNWSTVVFVSKELACINISWILQQDESL